MNRIKQQQWSIIPSDMFSEHKRNHLLRCWYFYLQQKEQKLKVKIVKYLSFLVENNAFFNKFPAKFAKRKIIIKPRQLSDFKYVFQVFKISEIKNILPYIIQFGYQLKALNV